MIKMSLMSPGLRIGRGNIPLVVDGQPLLTDGQGHWIEQSGQTAGMRDAFSTGS